MQENGGCYFNVMGDVVYTSAGYIADKVFYPKYWAGQNRYPQALAYTGRPNIRKGPIVFGFCGDTTRYNYARAFLDNSYLATINNLQNPVQKTADKTMKITYILREES